MTCIDRTRESTILHRDVMQERWEQIPKRMKKANLCSKEPEGVSGLRVVPLSSEVVEAATKEEEAGLDLVRLDQLVV